MANKEKDIFLSQPKTHPKDGTSSGLVPDNLRKVNVVAIMRLEQEVDNHMSDNLNEISKSPLSSSDAIPLILLMILKSLKRISPLIQ